LARTGAFRALWDGRGQGLGSITSHVPPSRSARRGRASRITSSFLTLNPQRPSTRRSRRRFRPDGTSLAITLYSRKKPGRFSPAEASGERRGQSWGSGRLVGRCRRSTRASTSVAPRHAPAPVRFAIPQRLAGELKVIRRHSRCSRHACQPSQSVWAEGGNFTWQDSQRSPAVIRGLSTDFPQTPHLAAKWLRGRLLGQTSSGADGRGRLRAKGRRHGRPVEVVQANGAGTTSVEPAPAGHTKRRSVFLGKAQWPGPILMFSDAFFVGANGIGLLYKYGWVPFLGRRRDAGAGRVPNPTRRICGRGDAFGVAAAGNSRRRDRRARRTVGFSSSERSFSGIKGRKIVTGLGARRRISIPADIDLEPFHLEIGRRKRRAARHLFPKVGPARQCFRPPDARQKMVRRKEGSLPDCYGAHCV